MGSSDSSEPKYRFTWQAVFGLVGIISLLISGFNIHLQNQQFNKLRLDDINNRIEEMYFINGLDIIISDLEHYGLICTISLHEIEMCASKEYRYEDIIDIINDINKRESIIDILEFNYDSSNIWFKLIPLGWPIFNAVVHGFQTYSDFLRDIMYVKNASYLLEKYNITEFKENIIGAATIIQNIDLYLTTSLQKISIEIRSQYITSWSDIYNLSKLDTIKNATEEFNEFNKLWVMWWDSTGNERVQLSNELNNWLTLHINT